MRYQTIPDDHLDRIDAAWPHLRLLTARLRANADSPQANVLEKTIADNIPAAQAYRHFNTLEWFYLCQCCARMPYGAYFVWLVATNGPNTKLRAKYGAEVAQAVVAGAVPLLERGEHRWVNVEAVDRLFAETVTDD